MILWYMRSKLLDGFYKSEVYVSSPNKFSAITEALAAYDRYIKDYLDDWGYHPLIQDSFPENENHVSQSLEARDLFQKELSDNLKSTKYTAVIDVSS